MRKSTFLFHALTTSLNSDTIFLLITKVIEIDMVADASQAKKSENAAFVPLVKWI